jgi:LysR family transcriptional regulator, hca operon transcriptional activator
MGGPCPTIRSVELRHLRYFVAVAEELSFTRAAAKVRTAQPSLSQQIIQLERIVGTSLFERTKRRVRLTPAGRVFLRDARDILNRVEMATEEALRAGLGRVRDLSIGLMPVVEVQILPKLLPAMAEAMPDVRLALHSLSLTGHLAGLRDHSLDVAFLWAPISEPDIVTEVVLQEKMVVVLRRDHPLAHQRTIGPHDLEHLPLIPLTRQAAPALHDMLQGFYQRAPKPVRVVQDADNLMGHLNMVRAGLGCTLLPSYVSTILPAGLVAKPFNWKPPLLATCVLAHLRDGPPPIIAKFKRVLRRALGLPARGLTDGVPVVAPRRRAGARKAQADAR